MSDILVRGLSTDMISRLKAAAKRHGRSLQAEVKAILQEAISLSLSDARKASEQWQKRLVGRKFKDSAESIREDRSR